MKRLPAIIATLILTFSGVRASQASTQVPNFKLKAGYYPLSFTAGALTSGAGKLNSFMTLEPSLLWDIPTFRSRLGIHFLGDFKSDYGLMPISGVGFSGYFYILGISSAYEIKEDGVLYQKSRPGPYVFGGLTPVNMNMSFTAAQTVNNKAANFAALVIDFNAALGYDFPLTDNVMLSGEIGYRTGNQSSSNSGGTVSYNGLGVMLSLSANYY